MPQKKLTTIRIKLVDENAKMPVKSKPDDAGWDCFINKFSDIELTEINNGTSTVSDKQKDYKKEMNPKKESFYILKPLKRVICNLGFMTAIPKGYYVSLVPRSGFALWFGITIVNTPATIDNNYRGEWLCIIENIGNIDVTLKIGERICQMILHKSEELCFEKVESLDETERGSGGFGSSGTK